MKHLVALALLGLVPLPDAELDKARADFRKALSDLRPAEVRDAADRLAATNQKAALDALLEGYGKCATGIKALWGDKIKYLTDREANGDFKIDLKTNPPSIVRSDVPKYERYLEADKLSRATEAKIMGIEACKRGIVQAMGKFRSDASVKDLVHEVAAGADWQRRAAAAEALGQIEHKDVLPALIDALKNDKEPAVRVALVEALRAQKNPASEVVAALAAQLQSEFWQLKSAAAFALQALGSKEAIEPLIEALPKNEGRLRADLNEALVGLTGTDKHGDYAAWKSWWAANREAVAKGTWKAAEGEGAGSSRKNATTTFYGIPVESRCVIFVLDRSGSMVEPSDWEAPKETATGAGAEPGGDIKKAGDRKIDIARWQMKKCIAQMPEGAEFNVIFFSHEFVVLSDKMLRISATTRKQAFEWIDKLDPFGGTNTFDALEKALSYASTGTAGEKLQKGGVDTIFLMTDGLPNSGQVPEAKDIVVRIRELNKIRKVKIHTVGVFTVSSGANAKQELKEKEEGTKFLKQLADENGGRFTGSGQPPKPDAKPEPKKSP
jgi:hypothetical protein